MIRKIFYFSFFLFTIISCEQSSKTRSAEFKYLPRALKGAKIENFLKEDLLEIIFDSKDVKIIRPPENELLGGVVSLSEAIDSIWYVKLETNENSTIKRIQSIQIHKERIYILDAQNRSILIFDWDGKFVRRIHNFGKGPGEYYDTHCFAVDPFRDQIVLLDDRMNQVHFFDLDGNFLRQEFVPYYFNEIDFLDENTMLLHKMRRNTAHFPMLETSELLLADSSWRVVGHGIPFDKRKQGKFGFMSFTCTHRNKQGLLYHPMFSDTIYKLSENRYQAKFLLDLGRYALPPNFDYNLSDKDFYRTYSDKLTFGSKWTAVDNYLFIELTSPKHGASFLIYNIKDDKIYCGSQIKKDVKNSAFFVPPRFSYKNIMIGHIKSSSVKKASEELSLYEDNKKYKDLIGPEIKELIASTSQYDNPILVFYSMK